MRHQIVLTLRAVRGGWAGIALFVLFNLRFIRRQPCVVCGGQRGVEAAHTGGHGMGQKACDRSTLPLCAMKHHRVGPQSLHVLGPVAFAERHGLDVGMLITEFNREYDSRVEQTA